MAVVTVNVMIIVDLNDSCFIGKSRVFIGPARSRDSDSDQQRSYAYGLEKRAVQFASV